jgi:hypothetical protein
VKAGAGPDTVAAHASDAARVVNAKTENARNMVYLRYPSRKRKKA